MKKNRRALIATALLLSVINLQLSTVFGQGSLTPPGPPGPTMKSLGQIEARTPVSAPATLVSPGSYYLTSDIVVSSGSAISITASGVTLDLNGFSIISTENPAGTSSAIQLGSGIHDVTIRNGHIRGGVTNNAGVYGGAGFGYGINFSGNVPVNVHVLNVSVSGCLNYGIYLGDATVESCTVRTVGSYGISAYTIKNCSAIDCGNTAISGSYVFGSWGQSSAGGDGVTAYDIARDCYGSSSSGNGLFAFDTAQNCCGQSNGSGYGLYATTALNCEGYSSSGNGLSANNTAQNCYGYSSSYTGLYSYVAIGCYGESSSGTGLSAFVANTCSGTSLSITHSFNSY